MKHKLYKKVLLFSSLFWLSGVTSVATVFAEETTISNEEVELAKESIKETLSSEAAKTFESSVPPAVTQETSDSSTNSSEEVKQESTLEGTIWLDENEDGIKDKEESGIQNYPVYLFKSEDLSQFEEQVLTDDKGKYSFKGLAEGDYRLGIKAERVGGREYLFPMGDDQEDNQFVWDQTAEYAYTKSFVLDGEDELNQLNAGMRQPMMIQPTSGTVNGTSVTIDKDSSLTLQQEIAALGVTPSTITELIILSSNNQLLTNVDIEYIIGNFPNLEVLDMSGIKYHQTAMNANTYSGNFSDLTKLKKVCIPSGLVAIVDALQSTAATFRNCSTLETVDFSASKQTLTNIGARAFASCPNLKNINLNVCTSLTSIGIASFSDVGITELSRNNLPLCIEMFEDQAFANCTQLTTVKLSNFVNLKTLGTAALRGATQLTDVDLSGCVSMILIGESVFKDCINLFSVDCSNCISMTTPGRGSFADSGITNVDFFNCVSIKRMEGFTNCTNLESLDLNACINLEFFDNGTFYGCTSLKDIYMLGVTKMVGIDVYGNGSYTTFDHVPNACIHVSPSKIATYQNDKYWKHYETVGTPSGSPNVHFQGDFLVMEEFIESGTNNTVALTDRQVVPMGNTYTQTSIPAIPGWLGLGYKIDSLAGALQTTMPINFTPINDVTTFYYTYGVARTITEKYVNEIGGSIGIPDTSEVLLDGDTYQKNVPTVTGYRIIGYRRGSPSAALQTATSLSFVANADETIYFVYSNSSLLVNSLSVNQKKVANGSTVDWRIEIKSTAPTSADNISANAAFPAGLTLVAGSITIERFNAGGVGQGQNPGVANDLNGTNSLGNLAQNESLVILFQTTVTGNPDEVLELPVTIAWSDVPTGPYSMVLSDTVRVTDDAMTYPPTNQDLEFVSVPKAFQFGIQDLKSTPQAIGLHNGAYQGHTNVVTQGFYVRIRDDRAVSTGWHLNVGLSNLLDNTGATMPNGAGTTIEMNNLSAEHILNPEKTNEQVDPLPTNVPTLINTQLTLTPGGTPTKIMSAAIGDGQGTWQMRIPYNDVTFNLPANAGRRNTNYQAKITWSLDDTP